MVLLVLVLVPRPLLFLHLEAERLRPRLLIRLLLIRLLQRLLLPRLLTQLLLRLRRGRGTPLHVFA